MLYKINFLAITQIYLHRQPSHRFIYIAQQHVINDEQLSESGHLKKNRKELFT